MIVVSTWKFGYDANQKAWAVLIEGGSALDAVVEGVSVTERDPSVRSVGYGGHPNAEGVVQIDGAVMDGRNLGYGAVAGLEGIATAAAVARRVMEKTNHVLLVGEGARVFAVDQGFSEQEMLTSETTAEWEAWRMKRSGETLSDDDTLPGNVHLTLLFVPSTYGTVDTD